MTKDEIKELLDAMFAPFGLMADATLTSGKSHTWRSRTFSK